MRKLWCRFFICLLVSSISCALHGQSDQQTGAESSSAPLSNVSRQQMEQELGTISEALASTRRQLEQSQQQIEQLQEELAQMRRQLGNSGSGGVASGGDSMQAKSSDLAERVEALEAQVKIQDQTKVESSSKYPVRINGLVLFNGFLNRGGVDQIDLPSIAVPTTGSGSAGAGMRQTILGVEGFGPRIAGARTSADVNFDFFGGIPYTNYGTMAGLVRLRTAGVYFDWEHDSVQVGMETPLITPLSPTSYATVAEPGLAWAGNLWTWVPELRFLHQFVMPEEKRVGFEIGLLDPPAAGYNSITNVLRTPSPGERASQPGYEVRLSYGSRGEERGSHVGVSGYYSRQSYPSPTFGGTSTVGNDSWAFTTDWLWSFARRFELSGEGYRGRSLGGLGGGVYKDVLYGTEPDEGYAVIRGLNDIGGWTQLKTRFERSLEVNAAIGLDDGFASDFHAIVLPPNASATQLRARNRMLVANLIYRPKTYLIFSPEYRKIWTWPIYGTRSTADVFTLSAGYQF